MLGLTSAPLPVTAQDSFCPVMSPAVAPWQVIFSVVSTCLSASPTVKLSFFVASRSDGIEAFMVKFTVSAAMAETEVNTRNAAVAKRDLVRDIINPFLK